MSNAEKMKGAVAKPAPMYPPNSLKPQVRDPKTALSAFQVLKEHCFGAK